MGDRGTVSVNKPPGANLRAGLTARPLLVISGAAGARGLEATIDASGSNDEVAPSNRGGGGGAAPHRRARAHHVRRVYGRRALLAGRRLPVLPQEAVGGGFVQLAGGLAAFRVTRAVVGLVGNDEALKGECPRQACCSRALPSSRSIMATIGGRLSARSRANGIEWTKVQNQPSAIHAQFLELLHILSGGQPTD